MGAPSIAVTYNTMSCIKLETVGRGLFRGTGYAHGDGAKRTLEIRMIAMHSEQTPSRLTRGWCGLAGFSCVKSSVFRYGWGPGV